MPKIVKVVQGSYITLETKQALVREAKRQGVDHISTFTSEILEKAAKKIRREESYHNEEASDGQRAATN